VRFTDHPHLKRILMYDEFVGHPLRKDYPIDKRQPLIEMREVSSVPTQRKPPADLLNRP
jgi:NADH-quinone oxidoreductase subunit C